MRVLISLFIMLLLIPQAKATETFKNNYVGAIITHVAGKEDSFVKIAREYGMGYIEIKASNPHIDPWLIKENTKIIIPSMHILPESKRDGIIINLPEMRLYAFVNKGKAPVTYPLGIGRAGLSTPIGQTKIIRKMSDPVWRPTKRMREEDPSLPAKVEAGPDNPLGTHMLYFDWPEYGIHGTDKPYGIGRRVSSGCIRLYPEDIAQFYHLIPVGMNVRVIDQAIKVGWVNDDLYLEAHTEIEQANQMENGEAVNKVAITDEQFLLILDKAGEFSNKLDWEKIRQLIDKRSGIPEIIANRVRL